MPSIARRSVGSSPLARGLRLAYLAGRPPAGIIPARAGFTRTIAATSALVPGSSPLARGLLLGAVAAHSVSGIIPARAGFTDRQVEACLRPPDHPRSRGVYEEFADTVACSDGSSPLARGLRVRVRGVDYLPRIIPARAGFTPACRRPGRQLQDHPRSRGVYYRPLYTACGILGSSPLARGLHLAIGVIPTVGHPTRGRSPSLVT